MLYVLTCIASLGGLLFGYETGVAAGALRAAHATWQFSENDQVLLSSGTLRGTLITVFQLMVTIGILLAFVGNELFDGKPDSWRFLLLAGAVPGLILSGA